MEVKFSGLLNSSYKWTALSSSTFPGSPSESTCPALWLKGLQYQCSELEHFRRLQTHWIARFLYWMSDFPHLILPWTSWGGGGCWPWNAWKQEMAIERISLVWKKLQDNADPGISVFTSQVPVNTSLPVVLAFHTHLFGANQGPMTSVDGLVSQDGLAMAGHPRIPQMA